MPNENLKRNGPEFLPLRTYIKEFFIEVNVIDKDGKTIRTEKMDYGKSDDRIWLGKLSFWCWENGHKVLTSKCE